MYRQQTIVMSLDTGKLFEEIKKNEKTDEDESYFSDTDFDMKVQECIVSIQDSGGFVAAVQNFATSENLICIIAYEDNPSRLQGVQGVPELKIPV